MYNSTVEKVSQKNGQLSIEILQKEAELDLERSDDHQSQTIKTEPEEKTQSKYRVPHKAVQKLLFSWGFYWSNNKARPFVNGHERDEVVAKRKTLIDYFADNLNSHWMYLKTATGYACSYPNKETARIVISHD